MDYGSRRSNAVKSAFVICIVAGLFVPFTLSSCASMPPDPQAKLIAKGKEIFFNERFNGNGRTCGTCHPLQNNFTLDPAYASLMNWKPV